MAELWHVSNILAEDSDARIPEERWREQMEKLGAPAALSPSIPLRSGEASMAPSTSAQSALSPTVEERSPLVASQDLGPTAAEEPDDAAAGNTGTGPGATSNTVPSSDPSSNAVITTAGTTNTILNTAADTNSASDSRVEVSSPPRAYSQHVLLSFQLITLQICLVLNSCLLHLQRPTPLRRSRAPGHQRPDRT
jgi:hypothetical protein